MMVDYIESGKSNERIMRRVNGQSQKSSKSMPSLEIR